MPVNEFQFDNLIKDMEVFFFPLAREGEDRNSKVKYYYEIFRNHDYYILKKAINYLIAHRTTKYFPLPGEIQESYDMYMKDRSYASPEELDSYSCDKCHSTGFILQEYKHESQNYTKAIPCDCEKGRMMSRAAINVREKRKKGLPLF
jgi:hypothetical protein